MSLVCNICLLGFVGICRRVDRQWIINISNYFVMIVAGTITNLRERRGT
jgi:hypothetical protein